MAAPIEERVRRRLHAAHARPRVRWIARVFESRLDRLDASVVFGVSAADGEPRGGGDGGVDRVGDVEGRVGRARGVVASSGERGGEFLSNRALGLELYLDGGLHERAERRELATHGLDRRREVSISTRARERSAATGGWGGTRASIASKRASRAAERREGIGRGDGDSVARARAGGPPRRTGRPGGDEGRWNEARDSVERASSSGRTLDTNHAISSVMRTEGRGGVCAAGGLDGWRRSGVPGTTSSNVVAGAETETDDSVAPASCSSIPADDPPETFAPGVPTTASSPSTCRDVAYIRVHSTRPAWVTRARPGQQCAPNHFFVSSGFFRASEPQSGKFSITRQMRAAR